MFKDSCLSTLKIQKRLVCLFSYNLLFILLSYYKSLIFISKGYFYLMEHDKRSALRFVYQIFLMPRLKDFLNPNIQNSFGLISDFIDIFGFLI